MTQTLKIGTYEFASRLIVGTGKYPSMDVMRAAHEASGAEMVTVAIRRINLDDAGGKTMLDFIDRAHMRMLPEHRRLLHAPRMRFDRAARARAARHIGLDQARGDRRCGDAVSRRGGDARGRAELVRDGFTVLPYITDDPMVCKQLEEIGCAAVMPLAAPIGSGLGICNPSTIRIIVERAEVPVIVDAGVGTASDAAIAMELGVDALLMNTGIAAARDPVVMAQRDAARGRSRAERRSSRGGWRSGCTRTPRARCKI